MSTIEDPHAVAALLKSFIRQLPEPLFTFDLYEAFIQTQLAMGNTMPVWLSLTQKLIGTLPAVNQRVIKVLFSLLVEIASHSNVNLMTPSNLAIVIAPNVFKSRNENLLLVMQHTPILNTIVKNMIENYSFIWDS
jgi:ABC-type uncharacterized transport system permease subunit